MGAIIITGVPGVGKTTVINAAADAADIPVVVYGTEMFNIASERGLVKDRDEMRKLPAATQREVQEAPADAIAAKGTVIVDTHGTISTPSGYLPGIPAWVAQKLKPTMMVLIEADAKAISGRRSGDPTRLRDADSAEAIREHQAMNRMAAMAVAVQTGATVYIVVNEEGQVEAAAEKLAQAMR